MTARTAVLSVVLIALAAAVPPGRACGPAPPPGGYVDVADETAVIVWDAATKTQHFVRRASFRTGSKDFGFLVPTPSRPALAEADDGAFRLLERLTAPTPPPPRSGGPGCGCGGAPGAAAGSVTVIEEATVAGYDATVLRADDANALGEWLRARGYDDSPRLRDWLEPYVADGWMVTAFKVAKPDPAAPIATTAAVRMSFQTDRPFFPYREPAADNPVPNPPDTDRYYPQPHRLLRVYFVSTERTDGVARVGPPSAPAPREEGMGVRWSDALPADEGAELARLIRLPGGLPAGAYLTELEMRHQNRAGYGDIEFRRSAVQNRFDRDSISTKRASRPPAAPGCAACYALTACLAVMALGRVLRR